MAQHYIMSIDGLTQMYEIQRRQRLGEEADRPHRVHYKRIVT